MNFFVVRSQRRDFSSLGLFCFAISAAIFGWMAWPWLQGLYEVAQYWGAR